VPWWDCTLKWFVLCLLSFFWVVKTPKLAKYFPSFGTLVKHYCKTTWGP
jgi:hypothetical protein